MEFERVSARRDSPTFRTQVHNKTDGDLKQEHARYNYSHFHSPFNNHNRYMSSIGEESKLFLRDCTRYEPYATQTSTITSESDQAHSEYQFSHIGSASRALFAPHVFRAFPTPPHTTGALQHC
jgi:hypothetical protein